MTVAQAYARFMVVFFIAVGVPSIVKPLTDAPGGGLILWPEAAKVFGIFLGNWFHFVAHVLLGIIGLFAIRQTSAAREYARLILLVVTIFLIMGLTTDDGVWMVSANWNEISAAGEPLLTAAPSWYGYIPLNPADDVLHALVALSAILVGLTPLGLRPWGFWRKDTPSQAV